MIYFIITLMSICLALLLKNKSFVLNGSNDKKRIVPMAFMFSMLPFLFITVFRYEIGKDYNSYTRTYYEFGSGTHREWEILFQGVINIARFLESPHFIILFFGIVFCYFTFKLVYEQSESQTLSIALVLLTGTFLNSLSMIRQGAVTALFLYELRLLKKNDIKKMLIITFILTFFHKTAFVYFFVIILYYIVDYFMQHKPFDIKVVFALLVFISGTLIPYVRILIEWFAAQTHFYISAFNSIYDHGNWSGSLILYTLPLFLVATFVSVDQENRREYSLYYTFSWCSAFCAVILPIMPNGERIVYLFLPLSIVSCPYFISRFTLSKIKNKWLTRSLVKTLLLICFLIATVYYYFINNGDIEYLLPYKTIF